MKINNILFLATTTLLLVNCTRQEIEVPFNTGTVTAIMESEITKSNATDEGFFTWSSGDKITINTNDGDLEGTLLSGGDNSATGTFQYSHFENQIPTGYAIYPHSTGHEFSLDKETIKIHMPAEYNLGSAITNTNAVMLAVPTSRSTITSELNYNFSHLGGVIRFIFKNAPAGTSKFTLSLGGKKINGDFIVDLNNETKQISTSDAGEGEGLTTLNFNALTAETDITLFVPVPVGDYTGIEAKLYQGETILGTWGAVNATNNIGRRALVLMSPVEFDSVGGNIDNEQQVATQNQFKEAVENGGTITITETIALSENITIPATKEVVIDLNGNNLTGEGTIIVSEGATLNIVNNGTSAVTKSGEVSTNATITSSSDIIKASKDAVITIGEGVNLTTTGASCFCVWIPEGAEGVTLNTAGNLTATEIGSAAIYHNGKVNTGTINITGGKLNGTKEMAVYIAGNANVTISGDVEITGKTALEQRAGNLTVNGGKFTATEEFSVTENNNGSTTTGVAVAICQHNTKHDTQAIINGGTFTGAKNVYMKPYGEKTNVSLVVNKGTFSDPTPCYFLGDNANVTVNMLLDYEGPGFVTEAGQTVNLNMNSKKYTVTAPLVGSTGTQTLGFQLKQGSTVNFTGGTITSSEAKMLIQNYSNLTLTDVTLSPTIPDTMEGQTYYVLSNNCGNVNIEGETSITTPIFEGIKSYAFDVCRYGSYKSPTVTWNSTGTVIGGIELSGGEFILKENLTLTKPVVVNALEGVDVSLDLGSKTLTTKEEISDNYSSAVIVYGGKLTVKNGTIQTSGGTTHKKMGAIWVREENPATVTINDGVTLKGNSWDTNATGQTDFMATVYVSNPRGFVKINGGTFYCVQQTQVEGQNQILNYKNEFNTKNISVTGGKFYGMNPAEGNGTEVSYLANGYKSTETTENNIKVYTVTSETE